VAYRQLAVADAAGGSAGYTGELALGEAYHVHLAGAAAAGNLLAAREVPAAMLAAFTGAADEELGDRLVAALQAGLAAGGEVTPVRSAGLLIADTEPWPVTDLRVDWDDDPVGRLAALWQAWQPQAALYVQRALNPAEVSELSRPRRLRRAGGARHSPPRAERNRPAHAGWLSCREVTSHPAFLSLRRSPPP
jgi:uncharacterized Ntn-hydrolase superfamily protein